MARRFGVMGGGRTDRRLDEAGLRHLLEWCQDGVVSRQQIRQLGGTDADIARVVRRRELRVVHPGVYADHTGPLTWQQRAWAAVLFYWPAALAGASALRDPPLTGPIHVAVDLRRTVKPVPGVLARRTADFSRWVRWQTSPPRVVLEHAVIDLVAATGDQFEKYRILATACQSRETWPQAIATALASRRRVVGRAFLRELLRDLGTAPVRSWRGSTSTSNADTACPSRAGARPRRPSPGGPPTATWTTPTTG